ncbi:MAG: hypothetical protein WKG07_43535 [Hymenobacter sp.]
MVLTVVSAGSGAGSAALQVLDQAGAALPQQLHQLLLGAGEFGKGGCMIGRSK